MNLSGHLFHKFKILIDLKCYLLVQVIQANFIFYFHILQFIWMEIQPSDHFYLINLINCHFVILQFILFLI